MHLGPFLHSQLCSVVHGTIEGLGNISRAESMATSTRGTGSAGSWRHVGAPRASCLRTATLSLFRGGDGGPGRERDISEATYPSGALKGFLSDADPMLLADRGLSLSCRPSSAKSSVLSHFLCVPELSCQGEAGSALGEEEDGVE